MSGRKDYCLPLSNCLWSIVAAALVLSVPDATARGLGDKSADTRPEIGNRAATLETLSARLAEYPGDLEARFLYARMLAWDQQWAASLEQFDRLLSNNADDVDYLFGRAQVLVWSGNPRDALPLLERARALAPDYEAVWQLEAQAMLALNEPARRTDGTSSHIEGGFSLENLSNDLPDWTSLYLHAGHQLGERRSIWGQLRQTERFEETDQELATGLYWPVGRDWTATATASLAPDAVVLPEWTFAARLQRPLIRGYGMQVGVQHSEYASASVRMMTLTGDYYRGNYYAGWTVYLSKLEQADVTFANQWRVDRYYGERSRVGVLVALGEETESVGNGIFTTDDTLSLVLTGIHWLNPDWGVSWDLIYHEQGDAYRRGGFRVGLRRQF